jgi:hypothetical protein
LAVEKAGFSKKVLTDVQVAAEQLQGINLTLDVGQITQTVNVDAAVIPQIDTQSAMISGTVTNQEIHDLPSFDRDPYLLTRLAPGVFGDGQNLAGFNIGSSGGIFGVENGVQVTANGARQNAQFAIECNSTAQAAYLEQTGEHGISLPDPVAMSIALDPSVATSWSSHYVDIETQSELTRGMTVVDRLGVATNERNRLAWKELLQHPPNARVCWTIDVDKWKAALFAALASPQIRTEPEA